MGVDRAQFRNTTTGWIGAVRITGHGEEKGVAIEPGDTVWLSMEEQEATANAPRNEADNPFLARPYEIHDPNTGELLEEGVRPPLELVAEARPVPGLGREVPGVPAPEGSYQPGEEVGTPVGD